MEVGKIQNVTLNINGKLIEVTPCNYTVFPKGELEYEPKTKEELITILKEKGVGLVWGTRVKPIAYTFSEDSSIVITDRRMFESAINTITREEWESE